MKTITIIGAKKIDVVPCLLSGEQRWDAIVEGEEKMSISDGYHTMDELYEHRITLYIALCKQITHQPYESEGKFKVWRSIHHSDGKLCFGTGTQFVLGIGDGLGKQITYHIPIERWDETDFAENMPMAPKWDGHTSADVLERISKL
jgi:hypothetical protein